MVIQINKPLPPLWARTKALAALVALTLPFAAQAHIELPLMYSDHAVLQRDQPMHIWGWSAPGATVQATFDGAQASAKAGKDGRFDITLPAHHAGGPYVLELDDGTDKRRVSDVLVGDVWLCSGQSNMEFMVSQGRDAAKEIANGTDNAIRHFKVPNSWAPAPEDRLAGGEWQAATPATVGSFSAACWFFAREMERKSGVPQGLMNSTWGGSRIETWMNARTAGVNPADIVATMKKMDDKERVATNETRQRLSRWNDPTPHAGLPWSSPDLDTREWVPITVPGYWESQGYYGMDGIAWYRTTFTLTAREATRGITLGLAMVDDSDNTFVNGEQIGETKEQWNGVRAYHVAASHLHAGTNSLVVKVTDLGAGGGIHGDSDLLFVQPDGGVKRPIDGTWLFRPDNVTVSGTDGKNQLATLLYNKMIHPLLGMPIRGVLWYQGEGNAATSAEALAYRDQFAGLIRQWRSEWKQPALPFVWVQLANWTAGNDTPSSSPWAELRESQSANLALPATGEAVIIDIGNPDNIHPTNKQDVGHRLAMAMRHVAFGDGGVWSGPRYHDATFANGRATVNFNLYGGTLAVRGGGGPVGFEVAGSDGRFHPATAHIQGNSVVVQSTDVVTPVAVRYAWQSNPDKANLTNADGIPASPFRSNGPTAGSAR
ncbi:sialate O-acetylesterase [Luteibacter sp. Sphag1AF]|uniref:sialate O-acetylesterase n=1 Tax=Luteibacter sp. Sphag1AF TaxID=2587031 RepID=UPI0016144535|nr:sialate O-acetylesterase [Luteibacter sp. Sphag1AF]MBB3226024.1 sialate O-acetylesterase [Luteibacter sp. Sphag1AF]